LTFVINSMLMMSRYLVLCFKKLKEITSNDAQIKIKLIASSPWAVKLSWQHSCINIFYDNL